jgi:hypothetical protein
MRLIPKSACNCNVGDRFAGRYQHGLGSRNASRGYECHRGQSYSLLERTRKVTFADRNQFRKRINIQLRLKIALNVGNYPLSSPVCEAGRGFSDSTCRSNGVQLIRQHRGRHAQTAPGRPAIGFEQYHRTADKLSGLI